MRYHAALLFAVVIVLSGLSATVGATQDLVQDPTQDLAAVPTEIPFVIDDHEAVGGVRVASSLERVPIAAARVSELLPGDGMTVVFLLDDVDEYVALDVVSTGVKETLLFNAENTAKANVVFAMSMIGVPPALQLAAYARLTEHPRFAELVELYRVAGRHLSTEQAIDLALRIGIDTARQVRKEEVYKIGG